MRTRLRILTGVLLAGSSLAYGGIWDDMDLVGKDATIDEVVSAEIAHVTPRELKNSCRQCRDHVDHGQHDKDLVAYGNGDSDGDAYACEKCADAHKNHHKDCGWFKGKWFKNWSFFPRGFGLRTAWAWYDGKWRMDDDGHVELFIQWMKGDTQEPAIEIFGGYGRSDFKESGTSNGDIWTTGAVLYPLTYSFWDDHIVTALGVGGGFVSFGFTSACVNTGGPMARAAVLYKLAPNVHMGAYGDVWWVFGNFRGSDGLMGSAGLQLTLVR